MEIVLGFGSNIGNRRTTIEQAYDMLSRTLGKMTKCSSFIETEPWGFECKDKFINSVAVFETLLSPLEALKVCNETEYALGRRRNNAVGYASRTIDIDILFCEDRIIDTAELQVPHPLIDKRNFVLLPLKEILPDFVHPLLNKKIKDI